MKIGEYRRKKKLTLQALADLVGCSVASIYRYENGQRWPTRSAMERITEITKGKVRANDFVEQADNEAA